MPSEKLLLSYVPCASAREAKRLGKNAVEKRLAACANVLSGVKSFYWWKGGIVEESEALLLLKTSSGLAKKLSAFVKKSHSYEVPCIGFFEFKSVNADYAKWVFEAVK